MNPLINLKTSYAYNKKINLVVTKKKEPLQNKDSFIAYIERERGLFAILGALITFDMIDKMLRYDYKYELSRFQQTEKFKTPKGFMKFIAKTMDHAFDLVANDIKAKHFNGFKTYLTFNTRILKFSTSFQRAKPLQNVSVFTKRIEGFYPKQKEFYDMTGGNKNYHTIEIMTDVSEKTSIFSNIFSGFTYLKRYIIDMLSQISHLSFKKLFKTKFIKTSRYRNRHRIYLNGYKARLRRRRARYKPYIPRRIFKTLDKKLKIIKTKRTRRKFTRIQRRVLKIFRFKKAKRKIPKRSRKILKIKIKRHSKNKRKLLLKSRPTLKHYATQIKRNLKSTKRLKKIKYIYYKPEKHAKRKKIKYIRK